MDERSLRDLLFRFPETCERVRVSLQVRLLTE